MNAKTFLFVKAWMEPLKTLPLEQRWNVMEAVAEYATAGTLTKQLDTMETIAFLFIRNEIDRMNAYREEQRERRLAAANSSKKKDSEPINEAPEKYANDANDANDASAYNPMQEDAPFDIISVSESVSESKSESVKKSSSSTRVRVREGMPELEAVLEQHYPSIFQSSMRRVSDEKLTPILNTFLPSTSKRNAYSFSSICLNASSAVESYLSSMT